MKSEVTWKKRFHFLTIALEIRIRINDFDSDRLSSRRSFANNDISRLERNYCFEKANQPPQQPLIDTDFPFSFYIFQNINKKPTKKSYILL
jgi:hypothetical protein